MTAPFRRPASQGNIPLPWPWAEGCQCSSRDSRWSTARTPRVRIGSVRVIAEVAGRHRRHRVRLEEADLAAQELQLGTQPSGGIPPEAENRIRVGDGGREQSRVSTSRSYLRMASMMRRTQRLGRGAGDEQGSQAGWGKMLMSDAAGAVRR